MKQLYDLIYERLITFKNKPLDNDRIIQLYWLTNMACKVVYVDNHYQASTLDQVKRIYSIYNQVLTSKVIDLEKYVASQHNHNYETSMSNSFINSTNFDIITINTIREVLEEFNRQSANKLKIAKIPKMSVNGQTI